jgi:hypothetical protein
MATTTEDKRNRELASRVDGLVRDAAQDATRATGLTLTQFARIYQSAGTAGRAQPPANPPKNPQGH